MPVAQVVDLYHLDKEPDFHALKASDVAGVILKASQGAAGVDSKFEGWYERALTVFGAGMVHSYHMMDGSSAHSQVDHYLKVTDGKPGRWLDYELNACHIETAVGCCHDLAQKQGRYPGMYGSDAGPLGVAILQGHFASVCPLWIARYGPKPPLHACDLWQFAEADANHEYDVSVYIGRTGQSLTKWMIGLTVST